MIIYNYDLNGQFTGQSIADIDPLNPDLYLIPANATTIQPCDVLENQIAVFNGEEWQAVTIEEPQRNLIGEQVIAIDSHILQIIKTANIIGEPANYDSIGELVMYIHSNNDAYRVEAQTLIAFVEQCHAIQADIVSGVLVFDSVDDAIAALPSI